MGNNISRRRRLFPSALIGIVALSTVAVSGPAHAGPGAFCARPNEAAALNARVLQTELMVAALMCGERSQYNAFVRHFEHQLVARGRTLRAYFRRVHGSGAGPRLNSFITRLANEASQRSTAMGQGYCAAMGEVFARTLSLAPDDLWVMASSDGIKGLHGVSQCSDPDERHETLMAKTDDGASADDTGPANPRKAPRPLRQLPRRANQVYTSTANGVL